MNFFGYIGKGKGSEQDKSLDASLSEEARSYSKAYQGSYIKKIKRLLVLDSTRENLTDNELLTYTQYDIKLHDLVYKSVFLGIGLAICGRIIVRKLNLRLTRKDKYWCDLLGFCTVFNFLYINEYPKLYEILSSRLDRDDERGERVNKDQDYEKTRQQAILNYRSKFFTDSQYWH